MANAANYAATINTLQSTNQCRKVIFFAANVEKKLKKLDDSESATTN